MRKLWILALAGIICTCASTSTNTSTSAVASNMADLDTAIKQASDEINEALPEGTKVALLNFTSSSALLSDYVLEEMSMTLVKGRKLTVVDRKEIDLLRGEMNFQMSGEVDDESAQEIGKLLGAQSIVSGSLISMGDSYRFRTKVINVNTAAIETSASISVKSDSQMSHLLGQSGGSSTAQRTTTAPAAQSGSRVQDINVTVVNNIGATVGAFLYAPNGSDDESETRTIAFIDNPIENRNSRQFSLPSLNTAGKYDFALVSLDGEGFIKINNSITQNMTITFVASDKFQPPPVAYKIGDTGPAGGLIFYDKGNNNGGWRYLEAGPVDIEVYGKWSVRQSKIENLAQTIGSGKRNTQLIVDKFKQTSGEWDTVAQKIDDLVFNGFDDWFIPSSGELDLMYGNLKRRNLGNFKNEKYWTSSTNASGSYVYVQSFSSGGMDSNSVYADLYARPIRQVPGPDR